MVQTHPQALFSLETEVEDSAEHGEVFTRPWVVSFILDLVDYTADRDLASLRLVEPACGSGSFLEVIARRVSDSCRRYGRDIASAQDCVRALDLLPRHVEAARLRVESALTQEGWERPLARRVAQTWIRRGDYLLDALPDFPADVVVGNPPYVRLESVADERMALYRQACTTMVGRADLYIGFFETALASLRPGGMLGFICADRWMRNQYGRELRRLVTTNHAVDVTVNMHDVDAFEAVVSAYPAITVLRRGKQGPAVVAETARDFGSVGAQELHAWIRNSNEQTKTGQGFSAARLPHWFAGDDMWPAGSPARLRLLEELGDRFVRLGDSSAGVRIGIGVATGADRVFITTDPSIVEPERLLPLSMVRDLASGELRWSGSYLVNPWDEQGRLVRLEDYPRLAAYLAGHGVALRGRHVGRRQPANWYRTIDKVDAALTARPKLLIPDMKLTSQPVLDPGGYYPHHNLYFVTSDVWDLRVLGGLLFSEVAEALVNAYAVKMRGGTLRFQAQYLRRIRIPHRTAIRPEVGDALATAFDHRDRSAATEAALRAYGIDRLPS